jgi:hypothetical protein
MAHRDPQQIERLIRKFDFEAFDFYIHLDKKIDKKDFEYLASLDRVFFVDRRIKVRWASYSFINAVLTSFKHVLDTGKPYDFISVMSGQDYPIKPVTAILSSLENNPGKNFISFEERDEWWSHAITRIRHYHFTNFDFRGRYRIQSVINKILPKRVFPLPYVLYGGPRAMCMTLGMDCVQYVVDFISAHKRLRRFAFFTWGPDEFLIPTLIMNSKFRDTVVNNNFYYIDWSGGGSNPKTLTVEDFEVLQKTDKMLARKFDISKDKAILDMIDEMKFAG